MNKAYAGMKISSTISSHIGYTRQVMNVAFLIWSLEDTTTQPTNFTGATSA